MPKQKISAKELVDDIRAGMDNSALAEKYKLSAQGLQSVFNKLIAAGALQQAELDKRVPLAERTVDLVWKCPACGKPQPREFKECPACGIIVAKLTALEVSNSQETSGPSSPRSLSITTWIAIGACLVLLSGLFLYTLYSNKAERLRMRQMEAELTQKLETEKRLRLEAENRARQGDLEAEKSTPKREEAESAANRDQETESGAVAAIERLRADQKKRELEARMEDSIKRLIGVLNGLGRYGDAAKLETLIRQGRIQEAGRLGEDIGRNIK